MSNLFKSIKRTPYQSLASFLILFFTLFMTLFFFHLISFLYGALSYVETKPQVTVYFKTQTPENEIFKIKETISASGKSSSIKYVSKETALKIYRGLNKDNPLLLEMVSADILPASLEIYAKKPSYLSEIAEFIKKQKGVDEVDFQKNIVDKLLSLTNIFRKISLFIFGLLIAVSFITLMTATAFKIASKKEELELLRLLGASRFYVRKPFLLEGGFFGLISAVSACSVFYGIFFSLQSAMSGYLIGMQKFSFYNLEKYNLYVWPPSLQFIILSYILIIFFGMIIGFIGNFLATSKYIK